MVHGVGVNRDGERVPAQDRQDFDELISSVRCKLDRGRRRRVTDPPTLKTLDYRWDSGRCRSLRSAPSEG